MTLVLRSIGISVLYQNSVIILMTSNRRIGSGSPACTII